MKTIELTQGQVALVDDEDFERLNQVKWCAYKTKRTFYAVRSSPRNPDGTQQFIRMHREILQAPLNLDVDHRDGNGLDNRRQNLRLCTEAQNVFNRRKMTAALHPFKGVGYDKRCHKNPWHARIRVDGRLRHLGMFPDPISAAIAYDQAALQWFGDFSHLNFPSTKTEAVPETISVT